MSRFRRIQWIKFRIVCILVLGMCEDSGDIYEGGKTFHCDCFEDCEITVKVDDNWIYIHVNGQEIILNPNTAREFVGYVASAVHNPTTG